MNGKVVKTISDSELGKGIHQFNWITENIENGDIYLVRISTNKQIESKQIQVIK